MAIFRKNEPETIRPRDRATQGRTAQGEGAMSIVASGMIIVGDLLTDGSLRIEGEVRGRIRAERSVVLGVSGVVEGEINTADAVIGGKMVGTIVATSRLELQATAIVEGEITTRPEHLKLEEGSTFSGIVRLMGEDGPQEDPESNAEGSHRGEPFQLAAEPG